MIHRADKQESIITKPCTELNKDLKLLSDVWKDQAKCKEEVSIFQLMIYKCQINDQQLVTICVHLIKQDFVH